VSAANDEGITALHNAICAGHICVAEYLVNCGCDVNAPDNDGWLVDILINFCILPAMVYCYRTTFVWPYTDQSVCQHTQLRTENFYF